MLVLSRKLSDTIKIGDEIEVSVLAIEGDQIKLGIQAPKTVDIHRGEVYKAIQLENSAAASQTVDISKLIDTNTNK